MPRGKATGIKLRGVNASSYSVNDFCGAGSNGNQNVATIALLAARNNDVAVDSKAGKTLSEVYT